MKIDSGFEFLIKILILGDSGVGKTNFITRFAENKFSAIHTTTIGIDYKSKIIKLPTSKKSIKMQVWDTAGQERFMSINKNLFHKIQGIILMYDITERESFEHITNWLGVINQSVNNKPIVIVGNKADLSDERRIVTIDEGKDIAEKNDALFFETSGATGENVDKIFEEVGEEIYQKIIDERNEMEESTRKTLRQRNKTKRKCCG